MRAWLFSWLAIWQLSRFPPQRHSGGRESSVLDQQGQRRSGGSPTGTRGDYRDLRLTVFARVESTSLQSARNQEKAKMDCANVEDHDSDAPNMPAHPLQSRSLIHLVARWIKLEPSSELSSLRSHQSQRESLVGNPPILRLRGRGDGTIILFTSALHASDISGPPFCQEFKIAFRRRDCTLLLFCFYYT